MERVEPHTVIVVSVSYSLTKLVYKKKTDIVKTAYALKQSTRILDSESR